MAKFKKKRSDPTKGREPEKPPAEPERPSSEAPPSAPPPEDPPAPPADGEPQQSAEQQSEKDAKLNRLFWLRVGFAVAAGAAAAFVLEPFEGEERRWASIGLMIAVFVVTIIIGKAMRIPFSLADRKKIVTQGIGSYVFMYLFVWIMTYTFANTGGAGSALPFP